MMCQSNSSKMNLFRMRMEALQYQHKHYLNDSMKISTEAGSKYRDRQTDRSGQGSLSTQCTLIPFRASIKPSMPSRHSSGATYRN